MKTEIIIILGLVVAVSACTDIQDSGKSGSAIRIQELSISDSTLMPGQRAQLNLKIVNLNQHRVRFHEVSLYNTGFLKINGKTCTNTKMKSRRDGYKPRMRCKWIIQAPKNFKDSAFRSKTIPVSLNLVYSSNISNKQDNFKVKFKPVSEIKESSQKTATYSNGEVKYKLESTNPATMEGTTLDIKINAGGPGRVKGNYKLFLSPDTVFKNCKDGETVEKVIRDKASISCDIVPGSSQAVTRHIQIATSYKYVKAPSLDIEVVNPQ